MWFNRRDLLPVSLIPLQIRVWQWYIVVWGPKPGVLNTLEYDLVKPPPCVPVIETALCIRTIA